MSQTVSLSTAEAVAIFNALTTLSQRTLPNLPADLRVGKALRVLKPITEDYIEAINKVKARYRQPGSDAPTDQTAFDAEMQALVDEKHEVMLPDPLTKDMLPQELATKPDNLVGRAQIIFGLGCLYAIPEDA